ncbi:MAG: fumarylacetoacetate hydrolase family protein [Chloroflexi bacterium]|nr:fumarylacetoacetate hydrolase family protein [Chloroflexota bacterium]
MKIVRYCPATSRKCGRLGLLVERPEGTYVLDLARARVWAFPGSRQSPIPNDVLPLLRSGQKALAMAQKVLDAALSRWDDLPFGVAMPVGDVRLEAPIGRPGKIICPGLNFRKHLEETQGPGAKPPERPYGFLKAPSSVIGPDDPIVMPIWTQKLDYEVELAAVIGVGGTNIPREQALRHVAGYTILNDVSAREVQAAERQAGFLTLGKSFPTSCPMGPYLLTADELPDPHILSMELRVNGEVRQQGHTSDLIHDFSAIIAYWSRMGLEPGDVISSGTPSGVALGREPDTSWYLKPGDVVEARIERLGTLRNPVAAPVG